MRIRLLHIILIVVALPLFTTCSTKKNTSGTRFYHAMTARFNTYFNGQQAFLEGIKEQETGHKDNYTEFLPIFNVRAKATAALGKSNFETAVTKCEKAIKQHSIKAKPKSNVNKKKTAAEKAYRARKEFNPFLKHAWLLLGKAQFQKGEFIEAASTFNYIITLYAGQPDVVSVARAYLARCYVELEWPYDAEDVFNKIGRDSITAEGRLERDRSYAAYLILTQQFKEAIPVLKRCVKKEKRKLQRARLNYLLGQLYHTEGNDADAYKAYKKVIRSNPPYDLAFNARIAQTEVTQQGNHSKIIKKLKRMGRNRKNVDYKDLIYYAIGNIYLADKDTARCIGAYEYGAKESTQNGSAKATLLLRLGGIYWEREDYINAQRVYAELIGILDKENKEYKEIEHRSTVLTELEPHLSAIKLQDSLQWLAKISEPERLAAIDRVIEALKKKEKEEAKKAVDEKMSQNLQAQNAASQNARPTTQNNANKGQTLWYFYNPSVVAQGKMQFVRTWGKRPLEDNWRMSHKKENSGSDFDEYDYSEENDSVAAAMADSIAVADSIAAVQQQLADSFAQDPHRREYYLQQIPFSEEQVQASNEILKSSLYEAGLIEIEKLENFSLAYRTLLRLLNDFPDTGNKDIIYYHMFLICGRLEQADEAEAFKEKLISEFPDSKYAIMLANPRYSLYARYGKHIEDSLYAATYEAYRVNKYDEVERNYQLSSQDFPEGAHRAKFMFIRAMSQLYGGQQDSFLVSLKQVIEKYPEDEITAMAKAIFKGIEEGRPLASGKYDVSDIWGRRSITATADSTSQAQTLSDDRLCSFVFLLAYPENSLDENQLLFEMARYNFTNFVVRNFDIEIVPEGGIVQFRIKGFNNFDEAHLYTQKLYADPHMSTLLKGIRSVIISEQNLKLLGTTFSYDDYKAFYDEHFAPLEIPKDLILDDTGVEIRTTDDEGPEYYEEDDDEEYRGAGNDNGTSGNDDDDGGIIF